MIKKILVASDGSKHAFRAAEKALEMTKQLGEGVSVTLCHIVSKPISRGELIHSKFDVKSLLENEAHQALIRIELLFRNENVPFNLHVAMGEAAEEIIQKANMENYDLVIVGSRGLNKLKELVIGSVSREVAHGAWCPVMIVK
ncbi:MAG: universal stress protein [Paenibacillus sp.]|uniref:universal stress protein n=1 Tax=Paenibacillus sp. TaxID=58172 RepID=UPI002903A54F|nr:universal stress protein [Paenibacillus sp.]MDU2241801.1 universal stress protein [Paenibacillus sp.]